MVSYSDSKESACNAGDLGSISGLGRSPGEGKGYPVQYCGLENSMDCIVCIHGLYSPWGCKKSDTTEWISQEISHETYHYYYNILLLKNFKCLLFSERVAELSIIFPSEKWKWKLLSCVWLFVTPWIYSPWNSAGQNTGVGSLSLLQGIFPTQGSNPGLLQCRRILYSLSHQGSPGPPGMSQITALFSY